MGIDGTQINTPHTLKSTTVSLLQTKKQHIAWLLGLVGVTIAAGSLAASGISRATANLADTTINSTVETVSTSASALTNLNNVNSSAGNNESSQDSPAATDPTNDSTGVNVSVKVSDGPAEVSVNGEDVNVPDRGTSRQTIATDNGNINVSVSNHLSADSDAKSSKSSSNSTFRIRSSTSTNESTKSISH